MNTIGYDDLTWAQADPDAVEIISSPDMGVMPELQARVKDGHILFQRINTCPLYTSPSPRD